MFPLISIETFFLPSSTSIHSCFVLKQFRKSFFMSVTDCAAIATKISWINLNIYLSYSLGFKEKPEVAWQQILPITWMNAYDKGFKSLLLHWVAQQQYSWEFLLQLLKTQKKIFRTDSESGKCYNCLTLCNFPFTLFHTTIREKGQLKTGGI